jgi:hypothetical protein
MEELLAPPAVGQAVRYTIDTRTRVQVPQGEMRHAGSATVQHTVLAARPDGYLVELLMLAQQVTQPNALAELLQDIARANSPLQIATDEQGNFLRIENKTALRNQWQELRPWLATKYQHLPGSAALLTQVATQYDSDNDRLEQALADKGTCGVLLPGVYGLRALAAASRQQPKTLHQFFNGGALPLQVHWQATAGDTFARTAEVVGKGTLDLPRFDANAFQHELAKLTPTPPARPAALQVQWQAQYTCSRTGQGLLSGHQQLRAVVPGLFAHETEHTLRLAEPLLPAYE